MSIINHLGDIYIKDNPEYVISILKTIHKKQETDKAIDDFTKLYSHQSKEEQTKYLEIVCSISDCKPFL